MDGRVKMSVGLGSQIVTLGFDNSSVRRDGLSHCGSGDGRLRRWTKQAKIADVRARGKEGRNK